MVLTHLISFACFVMLAMQQTIFAKGSVIGALVASITLPVHAASTTVPFSFQGQGATGSNIIITWSYGFSHHTPNLASTSPFIAPLGSLIPLGTPIVQDPPVTPPATIKKRIDYSAEQLGATLTNLSLKDDYKHGSSSSHDFRVTTIQRDNIFDKDGNPISNPVTDWFGFGLVDLTPLCKKPGQFEPNPTVPCQEITAFTELSVAGVTRRGEIKPMPELSPQEVGTNSTPKTSYKLAPVIPSTTLGSSLESNVLDVLFFVKDTALGTKPAVELVFGPKEPEKAESWTYQLEYEFNGLICILNPANSSCPYTFATSLSNYLTDESRWSYDPVNGSWSAIDYLTMPKLSATGLLGNNYPEDILTTTVSVPSNGLENVPSPLPILGVGAAFGYSRKLRKRIKTSKTPELMSPIG